MTEHDDCIHCQSHFEQFHDKLDRLDEAIRGNGKPGILLRLDRLERDAARQGRLIWLIVGAAITGTTSTLVFWLTRSIG
jgi:hypothetical protein